MKNSLLIACIILIFTIKTIAQVGISATNTPPNASAMLDVSSTSKGLLIPRMTTAQKNAIVVKPTGLMVFDITLNQFSYWNSANWVDVAGGAGGSSQWATSGINISNINTGNVGIGTTTPDEKLTILTSDGGKGLFHTNGEVGLFTDIQYIEEGEYNAGYIGTDGPLDLALTTFNGAPQILLKVNGNVGIGNDAPLNKVDIGVSPGFSGNELALGNGTQAMSFSLNPAAAIMYTNTKFAMMPAGGTGYLGIGTINPIAPLHITSTSTAVGNGISGGSGKIFSTTSNSLISYNGAIFPSILAEGAIVTKNFMSAFASVVASDSRVKNIIGISNRKNDLETINKIEVTDYTMKDVATWGTQTFKKVIAQQVEEVYPEVIKRQTQVIPDIYTLAERVNYDALNKKLSISLSKDYNIKIDDKIELVHPEKGKILSEVVEVSGKSFTVKDWQYATDRIFVFGREVSDFRSVDYEAISMLGISAIQQLAKENEEMKKENAKQKEDFNKRLEGIEATLRTMTNSTNIK
jgi:hypothetical protein